VASGLLAWLIRCLVKQALDRDIEVFKHELRKAHEIQMEEAKNRFTVGATSHMANVAFDKHIQFCEEYVKGVSDALLELHRMTVRADALGHANKLAEIRQRWLVWVPSELARALVQFEFALRDVGAHAEMAKELEPGEERHEAYRKAYIAFAEVVGLEKYRGTPVGKERAAETVIAELRDVLGIVELTRLRSELIKRAGVV
jgi:hypothetical protein